MLSFNEFITEKYSILIAKKKLLTLCSRGDVDIKIKDVILVNLLTKIISQRDAEKLFKQIT